MPKQIIAIGGGSFMQEPENPLLDQYFLQQTGKNTPKVCFVDTASGNDPALARLKFYETYTQFDCKPTHLNLFKAPTADLRSFILEQHAIYVGGGNTKNLLVLWREWGLDQVMREAWAQGIVLGGVSAGALCWFECGTTDSIPGPLTALYCLGFLKGSYSPHYDSEPTRRPIFHRMIQSGELLPAGLACDDGAAAHFVGDELYRVVSSRANAKGYRVRKTANGIEETALETTYLGAAT
jgi:peptidase E